MFIVVVVVAVVVVVVGGGECHFLVDQKVDHQLLMCLYPNKLMEVYLMYLMSHFQLETVHRTWKGG